MKINISKQSKALVEHYAYGILAAGYATYSFPGKTHTVKEIVIGGLVGGLIAPVLAKVNPKSLINSVSKETGAPVELVAPVVEAALANADKIVKDSTKK